VVKRVNGSLFYAGKVLCSDMRDLESDVRLGLRAKGITRGVVTVLEKGQRVARINIEQELA
jgi:hypothetical protein